MKRSLVWTTALAFVWIVSAASAMAQAQPLGSKDNPIVMTFEPAGDVFKIKKSSKELLKIIGQKTGLTFRFHVGRSFAYCIEAMGSDKAQIGWLNPFSYLVASRDYGVQVGLVFKREGKDYKNCEIIANQASGIKTLSDMKGKRVCFVDPESILGYIIPSIVLRANGIDPEKDFKRIKMAGRHRPVAVGVYKGVFDAGATFFGALTYPRFRMQKQFPDILEKVLRVDVSMNIPNEAIAFTKDFPADVREKVVQAILDIAESEEGRTLLASHPYSGSFDYPIEGFTGHDDSFFDEFRGLLGKAGVDPKDYVPLKPPTS